MEIFVQRAGAISKSYKARNMEPNIKGDFDYFPTLLNLLALVIMKRHRDFLCSDGFPRENCTIFCIAVGNKGTKILGASSNLIGLDI